jgi:hydrogenase maturation protease
LKRAMKRPLVIGYGNPLREDDGLGLRAAQMIQDRLPPGAVRVLTSRQLTPELAADVAGSSLVIFLDAESGTSPGLVTTRPLHAKRDASPSWTHTGSPAALLALSEALSGSAPPSFLVTGVIGGLGWSEHLSSIGNETAHKMCAAAVALLHP